MAGKRIASSELNHENWDEDYEPEEAGTFKRATEDVLKNRVIKTAKRRNTSNNESSTKNVFSNFGGFKKSEPSQAQASPFAFLSNMTKSSPTQNNTNGLTNTSSTSSSPAISKTDGPSNLFKIPDSNSALCNSKTDNQKNPNYYAKLKGLNESVSQWIKTHVDKNPFIILTPIFKDYEKYLNEIENSQNSSSETFKNTSEKLSTASTSPMESTNKSASHSVSIFGNLSNKSNENPFLSSNKPTTEGSPKDKTPTSTLPVQTSPPTFSFSSTSKLPSTSSGFTFGSGTPFQFANVSKPETTESSSKKEETQEDEDEPPKVEFTPVVEDGNIFQKRCKVFVKKEDQFADRGVGQLFLKPVEGSEKIQLIVRADTSLGNLLLNFILNTSIPMQRMGKNNVMLVSIPTPEAKPPPVPILLRVKTTEEADELLKILEKYRK